MEFLLTLLPNLVDKGVHLTGAILAMLIIIGVFKWLLEDYTQKNADLLDSVEEKLKKKKGAFSVADATIIQALTWRTNISYAVPVVCTILLALGL